MARDEPRHNHGRFMLCPKGCPREGMSDGPCAVCGKPSDPLSLVATGGGCDYPVCGKGHGQAVWDAIDAAQAAAEDRTLAPAPWPIAYPPDWVEPMGADDRVAAGTVADLKAWMAVPAHAKAVAQVRGEA